MQQVDELIGLYKEQHKNPANVAIVCGDFNIDGSNQEHFEQVRAKFAAVSMRDAWAESPAGTPRAAPPFGNERAGGQTARNDDGDSPNESDFDKVCIPLGGNHRDLYCDDTKPTASPSEFVGRFDYIWVEDPQPAHSYILDLARVRRRGFQRAVATDNQRFLSDHLGLETTLIVSPKP